MQQVSQLTPNGVPGIMDKTCKTAVLQLIQIKPMNNSNKKYKVKVSDGFVQNFALFVNKAAELIASNKMKANSIFRCEKFILSNTKGRMIILFPEITVLYTDVNTKIGNPIKLTEYTEKGNKNPQGSNIIYQKDLQGPNQQNQQRQSVQNNYQQQQQYQNNNQNNQNNQNNFQQQQQGQFQQNNRQSNNFQQNNQQNQFQQQQTNGNNRNSNNPYNNSYQLQSNNNNNMKQYTPIQALTPVVDSFLVKARVTFKGDKRTYQNDRGGGCVFGIEILDKNGGEMKCTMFNEQAEKFYPILEVGQVYEFSGGRIKVANKRYQRCDNDFALTFDYSTEILKVDEDQEIGTEQLNLTPLNEVANLVQGDNIDIMAIVCEVQDINQVTLKSGDNKDQRRITIVDQSKQKVGMTLWGDICNAEQIHLNSIIGLKCAQVREWRERKNLSFSFSTTFAQIDKNSLPYQMIVKFQQTQNNNYDECEMLGGDFTGGGARNITPIQQVKEMEEQSRFSSEPTWFTITGDVTRIIENTQWYEACGTCKRKVQEEGNGYRCNNCSIYLENCDIRYICYCKIQDGSGEMMATAFEPDAKTIMKIDASDLKNLKENNVEQFKKTMKNCMFRQYSFVLMAKSEQTEMGDYRTRYNLSKVKEMDHKKENDVMINMLGLYHQM